MWPGTRHTLPWECLRTRRGCGFPNYPTWNCNDGCHGGCNYGANNGSGWPFF